MLSLDNAIDALTSQQVNLQLEFSTDKDGYILYQLRVLPWRNSVRQGQMILVADQTISGCLILAAENLNADRWASLNWRVVLNEPGSYVGYSGMAIVRDDNTAPQKLQVVPKEPVKTRHASEGRKTD